MRVFVFGSNLAGRHGKGSAREAYLRHGAQRGVGEGPTGCAYAIPTKGYQLRTLPLPEIAAYVRRFMAYAHGHPGDEFDVVAIGCGLAGFTPEQIAPMFRSAPSNVHLPPEFLAVLKGPE